MTECVTSHYFLPCARILAQSDSLAVYFDLFLSWSFLVHASVDGESSTDYWEVEKPFSTSLSMFQYRSPDVKGHSSLRYHPQILDKCLTQRVQPTAPLGRKHYLPEGASRMESSSPCLLRDIFNSVTYADNVCFHISGVEGLLAAATSPLGERNSVHFLLSRLIVFRETHGLLR